MAAARASGAPPLPEGIVTDQAGQAGEEPQWVWLARIRRPQGRKGEVIADILTDFPEKFAERRQLWLLKLNAPGAAGISAVRSDVTPAQVKGTGFSPYVSQPKPERALAPEGNPPSNLRSSPAPREVTLIHHWLHKGGIILHFSGIDSISAAEQLAGLIVAIPRAERAALAEDEAYIGDLIGCALLDVSRVSESGGKPMLVGEIEDVDRTAGPVALLVVRGASDEILIPFAKSYLRKIDLEAKRVEMALPEGLVDLNAAEEA
jgi:16S rRNA processing protein RimM